jgi:hypothetical protein
MTSSSVASSMYKNLNIIEIILSFSFLVLAQAEVNLIWFPKYSQRPRYPLRGQLTCPPTV